MPPTAGAGTPASLADVARRIAALRDETASAAPRGAEDGVAAFARLYHDVTARLAELARAGRVAAPGFLDHLAVELADRFHAVLRRPAAAPAAWRLLLEHRADPRVPAANCVVAGVNAQLNLDLAGALVATWERVPPDEGGPDSAQYRGYCLLVDTVETLVEPLCARLDPAGAAHVADLAVRFTRDLAWDEAREVWTDGADEPRRARSAEKLDAIAALLGGRLLGLPSCSLP
jgi:hypothetical protein